MKRREALVGLGLVALTACSGQAVSQATTSSPSSALTSTSASVPTTKSPTTKPTPSSAAPSTVSFTVICSVKGAYPTFPNYEAALAAGSEDYCEAKVKSGTVYTDQQKQAVAAAYDGNLDSLGTLYAICAQSDPFYATEILSPSQAKEARGALTLCPEHPRAADIQAQLAQIDETAAAASSISAAASSLADASSSAAAAEAAGTRVSDGSYLIGTDIQPGAWQSVGDRVTNCYWELSDAQGNIIDNNFISVAPQFTLEVPSSAAGFTVRGCSFERVG